MRLLLVSFITLLSFQSFSQKLQVTALTTEHQNNPMGIDVRTPRFSWKIVSQQNDVMQTSYEIRVGEDASSTDVKKSIWLSGKVQSDQSVLVPYAGPALKSRKRYFWQVRTTDNKGNTSLWSEVKFFETGMLQSSDWKALWIEPDIASDSTG
jgi:alpha-L-rhamnosidase